MVRKNGDIDDTCKRNLTLCDLLAISQRQKQTLIMNKLLVIQFGEKFTLKKSYLGIRVSIMKWYLYFNSSG